MRAQHTLVEIDLGGRPAPALLPDLLRPLDIVEAFLLLRRDLPELGFRHLELVPELGNRLLLGVDVSLDPDELVPRSLELLGIALRQLLCVRLQVGVLVRQGLVARQNARKDRVEQLPLALERLVIVIHLLQDLDETFL